MAYKKNNNLFLNKKGEEYCIRLSVKRISDCVVVLKFYKPIKLYQIKCV